MSTPSSDAVLARASDAATPPHELERLARHRRRDVRSAVVANPNTDSDTLGALAAAFPEEFLANPILDWLLLEDPDWLSRLSQPARTAILRRPDLDSRLVWWALRSGETADQLSLLMNPSLDPAIVSEMTRAYEEAEEDEDEGQHDELGESDQPGAESSLVADHRDIVLTAEPSGDREVAPIEPQVKDGNSNRPEQEGEDLDLADEVRQAATLHVAAPVSSEDLSHPDQPIERSATDIDYLPSEVTEAIQEGVGHTPSETVELFALGLLPDWLIPAITMADSVEVRLGLAYSAKTPANTLSQLLFDDEESVRLAASRNPSMPKEAQLFFERVCDRDLSVTAGELRTLTKSGFGLRLACSHPNAERAYVTDAVVSHSWKIREAVATSPLLEAEDWYILACDPDRDVRAAVAANPTIPDAIRGLLLLDDDLLVSSAAKRDLDDSADSNGVEAASPTNAGAQTTSFTVPDRNHPASLLSPSEIHSLIGKGEFGRAMVARLPHLDPEMLRRFAGDSAWRVRQSAAGNPSTPDDALHTLAVDQDVDVREAVAGRETVPNDILETLSADTRATVRVVLARRDLPAFLPRFADDEEADVRWRVAENPVTNDDLIAKLATDQDQRVRLAVALRAQVPNGARTLLAVDDAQEVRSVFLMRADLSHSDHVNLLGSPHGWLSESLGKLLGGESIDSNHETRLVAAMDWAHVPLAKLPAMGAIGLEALCTSVSWQVREAVARHAHTSTALLEKLGSDLDYDVRTAVAENPNTPTGVLPAFLTDAMSRVRQGLANRTDVDSTTLELLALDNEAEVRKAARANPNLSAAAVEAIRALEEGLPLDPANFERFCAAGGMVQVAAAGHPQASESLLRSLHTSSDWSVRRSVANNANCPSDVLSTLVTDSDKDVRCAVARNPNTPSSCIAMLLGDAVDEVRQMALRSTTLTDHDRTAFAKKTATRVARSGAELSRVVAYSSPLLSDLELRRRRGWQSTNWLVRYALATNPVCPLDVLEHLAADANRVVRQTAERRIAERATRP